jgi:3'-phosphoadenosine 5'-phosphosulfate sulfotransferase (PAPS reductase)/FAD synthetase
VSVRSLLAAVDRPALRARLAGRRVVASISGGKDSEALSLFLTELEIEHDRVHCLTGWDHQSTVDHVTGVLSERLGPVQILKPPLLMEELCFKKAMFPSRTRRFCTPELKVFPIANYLKAQDCDCINAVGVRAAESEARARLPEWEYFDAGDCDVWRPLLHWTEEDVIEMHQRHALQPCSLYLRWGVTRVGCWPCIFARKADIRLIADVDPERIDRIRSLESQIAVAAQLRYDRDRSLWMAEPDPEPPLSSADKHLRWERKRDRLVRPFQAPAWFQADAKDADGRYRFMPIDEVVDWARTAHGGRQREMFLPDRRDTGCMRWGMCEVLTGGSP